MENQDTKHWIVINGLLIVNVLDVIKQDILQNIVLKNWKIYKNHMRVKMKIYKFNQVFLSKLKTIIKIKENAQELDHKNILI